MSRQVKISEMVEYCDNEEYYYDEDYDDEYAEEEYGYLSKHYDDEDEEDEDKIDDYDWDQTVRLSAAYILSNQ